MEIQENCVIPKKLALASTELKFCSQIGKFYTFNSVSKSDHKRLTIKVLDTNKCGSKAQINMNATAYCQETLQLCCTHPKRVSIASFQVNDSKFGFSMQRYSTMKQKIKGNEEGNISEEAQNDKTPDQSIDTEKMLKDLIENVQSISKTFSVDDPKSLFQLENICSFDECTTFFLSNWTKFVKSSTH